MTDAFGPASRCLVVGAGPAGLAAARSLIDTTGARPVVIESEAQVGGISRTVRRGGNRMDLGGHRFFSKSSDVMNWWMSVLPLQGAPAKDDLILGRCPTLSPDARAPDPEVEDSVMLTRSRCSRIYFRRKFFDYPVSAGLGTLRKLGAANSARIAFDYARARAAPRRPERTLEDFMVNRFGWSLYSTFFRDYTQKVWGVSPRELAPDWGAQRIRGLSVGSALGDALKSAIRLDRSVAQADAQTSLIRQFLYPKFGPGQLWEEVARSAQSDGAQLRLRTRLVGLELQGTRVVSAEVETADGIRESIPVDAVISSAPIGDLVAAIKPADAVPADVRRIAEGLPYRDFIAVGLLLNDLAKKGRPGDSATPGLIKDNWLYVQEPEVALGRLQIFNNWSPYLVEDLGLVWVGLEYFCTRGDELWDRADEELIALGLREMAQIGLLSEDARALDGVVVRVAKAYPGYFGTYAEFDTVRGYLDGLDNLYTVGRNGMHRYNNMDHSVLSAWAAVDTLARGVSSRQAIWDVNVRADHHEQG